MAEELDDVLDTPGEEQSPEEVRSPLDMSDDELANFNFEVPGAPATAPAVTEEEDSPDTETSDDDEDPNNTADPQNPAADDDEPAKAQPEAQAESAEAAADPVQAETTPDYKAVYDKLFAPFKANGKEMRVESVDDAIALMQMGANYNKKMAGLKPNLKLMKLMEMNGLLSEEKLSFFIDLDKKNPQAIQKLLKDSGIDPLDLDTSKESEYKPNTYTVDDRDIALDEVLEQIQDTPTYAKMLNIVSNKWDGPSKRVVADNPQLLRVINDHMATGIYDVISTEIERERMFGRLNGMSDIEAYKFVGDAIEARGGFAHLFPQAGKQGQQVPAPATAAPAKPKGEDPALRDKRRAASPTKATAPAPAKADFNPLALSDDEFSKQFNSRYL